MTTLLDGLKVIDLSLWQPGQYATQLLADLGADVVKVEPPGGDRMRPLADRFANINGRKHSLVLDLKDPHQRARLLGLVGEAEVVVENYRPGVTSRLGIGFDDLRVVNRAIVMCSISGYGQTGPLADVTGHEANYQAYSGAMTMVAGHGPVAAGTLTADMGSGLAAAFAILAAVLCARRTGEGEHIDVSMCDLMASWAAPMGPIDDRRPSPVALEEGPAMGTFETADGRFVVLGVFSEDHFWDSLCTVLGLDHRVGLKMGERLARSAALRVEVATAVLSRTGDELVPALARLAVPVAPVLSREEMLEHPHFRERGVVTTGTDGYRAIGHPILYAVHPALPPGPAPELPACDDYEKMDRA